MRTNLSKHLAKKKLKDFKSSEQSWAGRTTQGAKALSNRLATSIIITFFLVFVIASTILFSLLTTETERAVNRLHEEIILLEERVNELELLQERIENTEKLIYRKPSSWSK